MSGRKTTDGFPPISKGNREFVFIEDWLNNWFFFFCYYDWLAGRFATTSSSLLFALIFVVAAQYKGKGECVELVG